MKRLLLVIPLFIACQEETVNDNESAPVDQSQEVVEIIDDHHQLDSITAERFSQIGLVDLASYDDRIRIDLKYASTDNFMNEQLYDTLHQLFIQQEVAERLSKVQSLLDSLHPGYRLLVFDGVRPVQVQREMWNALDSIPVLNRGKFVSNPSLGSVHNFGAAVDLTIVDQKGEQLDMGAGYDDFRKIAFPSMEAHFLKTGELKKHQWENRKLLRKVMRSQKFSNIPSEWWHFNAWSRITASHKYQILDTESGATRWFKIVVKDTVMKDSIAVISD